MRRDLILFMAIIIEQIICHNWDRIKHLCDHDKISHHYMPKQVEDLINLKLSKQQLQKTEPQPFRVTFDTDQLDNIANGINMTQQKKDYILKLINATQMFLKQFIKVIPRTTPIKSLYKNTSCGKGSFIVNYPDYLLSSTGSGVPNSDLHMIVTYNEEESATIALASYCELDPSPIIGRVRFNIQTLKVKEDHSKFQDNFSTALHELTHALGFSGSGIQYWIDPDTNRMYLQNVGKVLKKTVLWGINDTSKLMSKNVVRTAQYHYNCPTIDGMFLENQSYAGSVGSHWEKDLLLNDYMSPVQLAEISVISEFTVSLLRDTGYYAEINSNFASDIYYGKNKGCDFFYNTCNSQIQYEEFNTPSEESQTRCVYYGIGAGMVSSSKMDPFTQCYASKLYVNGSCRDTVANKPNYKTRQNVGLNSKCFFSNAMQTGFQIPADKQTFARCFKTQCSTDYKFIDVYVWDEDYFTCKTPQEELDLAKVTKTSYGVVKCPKDFKQFCTFPRFCKNNCSSNGICINGYCICFDGYASEDCSVQCDSPKVYDGTNCVSKCNIGTYKNPDNMCKTTCPDRYYKDSNIGGCVICHRFCSSCTGPSQSECFDCNFGYELSSRSCNTFYCDTSCLTCKGSNQNQCLSCAESKYLDSYSQCKPCPSSCKTCTSSSICLTCQLNYQLDETTQQCFPICEPSCKTCSSPLNNSACTDCNDGSYLNTSSQCQPCKSPCSKCIGSANKCTGCISGYNYDSNSNTCNIPCSNPQCKTCVSPYSDKDCTSCYDGNFLSNNQCLPCQSPCKTCIDTQSKCLDCVLNYTYDKINNQCNPSCDASCKTCSLPNNSNSCISCNSGYFLNSLKQCEKCLSPCLTCEKSANLCISCINSIDYVYNYQKQQCDLKCHSSCLTCTKPNDNTSCTSCIDGFYLDETVNKCLESKIQQQIRAAKSTAKIATAAAISILCNFIIFNIFICFNLLVLIFKP